MRHLPTACLLLLSSLLFAPAAAEVMEVDDVLATRYAREIAVSPDGRWLAWTLDRPDEKANEWVHDLWRVDLTQKAAEAVRLTRDLDAGGLVWSPDSEWIGFVAEGPAKEDEKAAQVWRIRPDGGAAEPLTRRPSGVEGFVWATPERILLWAEEGEDLDDRLREEAEDDVRVVEDRLRWKPVRLFSLDLPTGALTRLTRNDDRIDAVWSAPDGHACVVRHITSPQHESQVGGPWPVYRLLPLDGGEARPVFEEPTFAPDRVAFGEDGHSLLASWTFSRLTTEDLRSGAGIETLWQIDLESGERHRIDQWELGLADHLGGPSWVTTRRGILAVLADRTHGRPVLYQRKGETWRRYDLEAEDPAHWQGLSADRQGEVLAWLHSTADTPQTLRAGRLRGTRVREARTVQAPQSDLRAKVAHSETITWKSPKDGAEITGILTRPRELKEGRRYPLMVWIHGGPTGVDADAFENYWASYPHLLAGRDMVVLQPNYRGSVNHGLDHVEAITGGRYYDYELDDILSGVDHLVEEGLVHPDSLGTMGWSNGAILSIALTVETDRFAVCCAGAGDVNWTSDFGNCAFGPNFDVLYFGDTPWADPLGYVEKSPLFRMEQVTAPTLIQFGEKDTSVPTSQGWEHYRALQMIGKAPVRFLLYPEQGHGLAKLSYQRRKIEEEVAWIEQHLRGAPAPALPVRKEGSPLDLALGREDLLTDDGRAGVLVQGVLAPPVASAPLSTGARLARVEVTRDMLAQMLRDDPGSNPLGLVGWDFAAARFLPGTGNLPATGFSAEVAEGFAQWLSTVTGQRWRLPTVAELEEAAEGDGPYAAENNLCRWAGYEPVFDEARRLRALMEEGDDPARWLREVASSAPRADQPVFDLHGNAAEYARQGDGIVVWGRCVLDGCAQPRPALGPTPPSLVGLRLVRDGEEASHE